MNFLFVFAFELFSLTLFSQETAGIEYSPEVDFNWGMFRGKINPHHIESMGKNTGAVTVSSLNYTSVIKGNSATIKVAALFLPSESWTRYPHLDHPEEALNHEKRHFDICEIYARKMRQILMQTHFNRYHFNEELDEIFKKMANEESNAQSTYDLETKHSINLAEQKKWNDKIDLALKTLSPYSKPVVVVYFK